MATRMVNRTFIRKMSSGHHVDPADAGKKADMWEKVFFFVAVPSIGLGILNCYLKSKEKQERPPFVPYEYLRIRTKRYPWGDGQRTLFHNPHVNALPTGYEDEH